MLNLCLTIYKSGVKEGILVTDMLSCVFETETFHLNLNPHVAHFDMFPLSHHTPHSHEYGDERCALKSGDLPPGGLPK